MSEKPLTFEDVKNIEKVSFRQEVILFLDKLTIAENVAGIARLADAFQVDTLILHDCFLSNTNKIQRMSRSTFARLKVIETVDLAAIQQQYQDRDWIGLEWTNKSHPVSNLSTKSPIVLVLGSEKHGISHEVLQHLKCCIHIDMFGLNSSMNVACATSIALYQIRQTELNDRN